MKTVTTRIPEENEKILAEIQEEEQTDRSEVLRKIIEKGIEEWRKDRALEMLRDNEVSIRKAAEMAGITYVEMLDLMEENGIRAGYTAEDLEEDLERL